MEEAEYILEYSEEQGRFHFNNGSVCPETHGWTTICSAISYNQCLEFANLMEDKYPAIGEDSPSTIYPATETIKKEFRNFLLT